MFINLYSYSITYMYSESAKQAKAPNLRAHASPKPNTTFLYNKRCPRKMMKVN